MAQHKIRPRADTADNWEKKNPVLDEREIGFEYEFYTPGHGRVKMKMGDGKKAWNQLPYAIDPTVTKENIEFHGDIWGALIKIGSIVIGCFNGSPAGDVVIPEKFRPTVQVPLVMPLESEYVQPSIFIINPDDGTLSFIDQNIDEYSVIYGIVVWTTYDLKPYFPEG